MAAGIQWREEGERSTKFFLNMANVKRAQCTLDFLSTDYGKISKIHDILDYAKVFYENLYSKVNPKTIDKFYNNCPKLSATAKQNLSQCLTLEDIKTALKSCKDSSPGLDGIPYSFYKTFGDLLLPLLLDSWKYSLATGILPVSQATSIISLIPKAGKDKHEIKNWRPISISPCDLKILTKALSIKVGNHLDEIISETQMGYVKGRNINFNNRILSAALTKCKENKLDFIITSLDAQKAYDSVDHEYILNTLEVYNFPKEFINTVKILNANMKAQVQVNGFISESFQINRGVKQGDALSCALFIIAIDPLIRNIEANKNITPLLLTKDCQVKTIAYADDIAVISNNSEEAVNNILQEYMKLTICSGLTLNADKTEILNLCENKASITNAVYNHSQFQIIHKSNITICGNFLSLDHNARYKSNITERINKLEQQLNRWKGRHLSINGKMLVVKTFAISQLIYSSQFQMINARDLRKIETICYKFIWNGTDRVKRCYVKSDRDKGGIGGIDIVSFFYSIAIRQYLKSDNNATLKLINSCPNTKEDIKTFARDILRKITINNVRNCNIHDTGDVENILASDISHYFKTYSKGHRICSSLKLTSVSSIDLANYSRGISNTLRKCLPPDLLLIIDSHINNNVLPIATVIDVEGKPISINKCSSRILNNAIKKVLGKSIPYHPKIKYKELENYFGDDRALWNNVWRIKNPTLRAVRLKILYKDVWSNDKRHKLGIASNYNCPVCGLRETTIHQLFECRNAIKIWNIYFLCTNLDIKPDDHALSGKDMTNLIEVSNDIILEIVKSVIFKLLIQIDRSANLDELQIKRVISLWVNIELKSLNKLAKGNKYLMNKLSSTLSKLNE